MIQPELSFLSGVAVTIAISLLVVWNLNNPLRLILTDLCGTEARAQFWQSFSNTCLVLVSLALSLRVELDEHRSSPVAAIASQIQGATIALVLTLVILGFVMSSTIEHQQRSAQTRPSHPER